MGAQKSHGDKAERQIRVSDSKSAFSKCHRFHVIVVCKLACSATIRSPLVMSPGQLMQKGSSASVVWYHKQRC